MLNITKTAFAESLSLPVREVWIEIFYHIPCNYERAVTSREGSVDWNHDGKEWERRTGVTSREGSVDWNMDQTALDNIWGKCHFPWGKCGLKSLWHSIFSLRLSSLPVREVWIEITISSMTFTAKMSLPVMEAWSDFFSEMFLVNFSKITGMSSFLLWVKKYFGVSGK